MSNILLNAQELKQEIIKSKRILFQLQVQQAKYGISCAPHIIINIEDISANIAAMEKALNNLEKE